MSRKPYPTDLTAQQWHVIGLLVPPAKAGSRSRTVIEPKPYGKKCAPHKGERQLNRAAVVDSQLVKTTEVAQEVGYDGGKLVKGHKRHLLVDTLGLLLQLFVSAEEPE